MFELPNDKIEFGQGIHGEAGYKRIKLQPVSKIVSLMIHEIVQSLNISKGNSIVLLINNFGALSQLEQGIVVKEVVMQLGKLKRIFYLYSLVKKKIEKSVKKFVEKFEISLYFNVTLC
jgi:dihydroxyacetone kinase